MNACVKCAQSYDFWMHESYTTWHSPSNLWSVWRTDFSASMIRRWVRQLNDGRNNVYNETRSCHISGAKRIGCCGRKIFKKRRSAWLLAPEGFPSGRRFLDADTVKQGINYHLAIIKGEIYDTGMQILVDRDDKCLNMDILCLFKSTACPKALSLKYW